MLFGPRFLRAFPPRTPWCSLPPPGDARAGRRADPLGRAAGLGGRSVHGWLVGS